MRWGNRRNTDHFQGVDSHDVALNCQARFVETCSMGNTHSSQRMSWDLIGWEDAKMSKSAGADFGQAVA